MKLLQNLMKANVTYGFGEDKKKFLKILKNKHLYHWRFVAPDQIPPFPPNIVLFKSQSGNFAIGKTNQKKINLGRIYQNNTKGLIINKKHNVRNIINESYFVLTKKNNIKNNIKLKINKKDFLNKINKYLTKDDILRIEKISNSKFLTLLNEIRKTKKNLFLKIQSNERWINSKKLNKLGLHLLRAVLSYRIFENRFKNKKLSSDISFFLENGYLIKKYKNFNSRKIKTFLNYFLKANIKKVIWRKVEFKHIKNDPQYKIHLDSFCNTFKVWMYPKNLKKENGVLCFFPKSHKLTIDKLKWLYKISCTNVGVKEPSFRLNKSFYSNYGKLKYATPLKKQKTVVIANTFMFHARSSAKPGTKRLSYRLLGDNDGGVKRSNPFF